MSLLEDLKIYYKLDETAGITATDETGNFNGTYTDAYTLDQDGKINRAVALSHGYVAFTRPTFTDSMSVSLWFKTTDAFATADFIFGLAQLQAIRLTNSTTIVWFPNAAVGASLTITGLPAFNDGEWHHLVITHRNGDGGIIYLDGAAHSGGCADLRTNGGTNLGRIGDYEGIGGVHFIGTVDEVGIWSRKLTSLEVDALYNNGAGLPYNNYKTTRGRLNLVKIELIPDIFKRASLSGESKVQRGFGAQPEQYIPEGPAG